MCSAAFVYHKAFVYHAASGGHYYGKSDAIHTNKARKIDHNGIKWKPPKERMTPEVLQDNMIETVQNVENQFTTQRTNHNPGNNITTI